MLQGNCPTIYGPVNSRRHGRSLGINLGDPKKKICTWGCLYCQSGMGERRDLMAEDSIPTSESVLQELKKTLQAVGPLDTLTFAGNSEPAAHPEFHKIVREIRKLKYAMRAEWIFNVLSNGSELDQESVRKAYDLLDEAWIKLDCGLNPLFQRLNRPLKKVGTVEDHIRRIKSLKKPRIQTLLWRCPQDSRLSNFTEENLAALLNGYREIQPIEIHVTTISREPAWSGLAPVSEEDLALFVERASEVCARVSAYPEALCRS